MQRLLLVILTLLLAGQAAAGADEWVRKRLENTAGAALLVGGSAVSATPSLRSFYEARAFSPAWTDKDGELNDQASRLLEEIRNSRAEGLNPDDYHLANITRLLGMPGSLGRQVDLELLFSDAWLVLASHYLGGRVNPETIDAEWVPSRRSGDLPLQLAQALAQQQVVSSLRSLLPQQVAYARLREELAKLRAQPPFEPMQIGAGKLLRPGQRDARVAALRERLGLAGEGDLYDPPLAEAVRAFQRQHGLEADGLIGEGSLRELNAGTAARIDQVLANLERWRWMPAQFGERHVRVNIAGYRLEMWDQGQMVDSMKVVIGKPYRRTPLFSDRIRYMVFNPTWEVPPKLAIQDKLPILQRDPASMQRSGFVALQGSGSEERLIDLLSVDWSKVTARTFNYRLRQQPGPKNALGRVKVMFPNRFNVYLHDTSNPELFARDARSFSSGCVRLEKPQRLVEWLLQNDAAWPPARIGEAMAGGETRTVMLQAPVPVHIQYWTTWVDSQGKVQFLSDIYQRDAKLAEALRSGVRE